MLQRSARDPYATAILDIGRNWWRETIIYEIYVQSFQDSNQDGIGDLQGIKTRLGYLKKLGIDMLWLTPFYKSPLKDQGYDISDYKELNPQVGTMADFEELVEAIHAKDMKFMLDVVFNHTSDEHPWFKQSRRSKDDPKRDWYFWRPGKMVDGEEKAPNNWSSLFGGPAWTKDEKTGEWYLHLFSSSQPDLNWDTEAVREAVGDVCDFWLEKGVDGFRMDVINLISKTPGLPDAPITDPSKYEQNAVSFFTNGPNVHKYLHELNVNVLSKREICTVGEMPCGVDPFQASEYVAHESRELDMVFQFTHIDIDATDGDKWKVRKWTVPELEKVFRIWQQHMLGNHGWNALYLENHDQARALARYGTQDPKYRDVCAKMLCTMLLTMRGTVFLFQGQELGAVHPKSWKVEEMRDVEAKMKYDEYYRERKKQNPDEEPDMSDILTQIGQRSRDNVRVPMPWNPPSKSKNVGFCDDDVEPWIKLGDYLEEINVETQEKDPNSVLNYFTKLINLRKMNPAMFYGSYVPLSFDDPKVFSYLRSQGPFRSFIILNFTEEDGVEFEVKGEMQIDMAVLFMSNYEITDVKLPPIIKLRPYEARVYSLREQIA